VCSGTIARSGAPAATPGLATSISLQVDRETLMQQGMECERRAGTIEARMSGAPVR
jgi:hypothetical protein